MTTLTILWIILAHWFADFVCQTHWQASNKSKNWLALYTHVSNYTLITTGLIAPILFPKDWKPFGLFLLITFTAHFITDAITSRITSRLYAKQSWHNFFVVIGFDQFLHYTQLFLAIQWLR